MLVMLEKINKLFIILVLFVAFIGISLSIIALFLPTLLGADLEYETISKMKTMDEFYIESTINSLSPTDSPYIMNITMYVPALKATDLVFLDVYSDGKYLISINCLDRYDYAEDYVDLKELNCQLSLPYNYENTTTYRVFGVFTREGTEYKTAPITLNADWEGYENSFWTLSAFLGGSIFLIYLVILLPLGIVIISIASKTKYKSEVPGGYSLTSLLLPFNYGKTIIEKLRNVIISPYFWLFEALGILIILAYMIITAQVWKSTAALVAFIISGLSAFIIPFIWCTAWWYADFKEREPVRIIITLFLWGMLSALMAIGLNSIAGEILAIFGVGFLSVFLIAPVAEEFYKGSGLCLLSEHREFDSIEDGIVFGFVIGMGFSFIENWIYFLGNPIGSDTLGWFFLFLLRSILFSANHGFYTAITGGVMGYIIERKFKAPGLGLLIGFPIAAIFHAIHNSGATLGALLGGLGTIFYCCFLIPIFDYGGFVLLILLFLRSVFRKKK
jgi:RsiW-degrading membrane proteinase PrsW (M82 family)